MPFPTYDEYIESKRKDAENIFNVSDPLEKNRLVNEILNQREREKNLAEHGVVYRGLSRGIDQTQGSGYAFLGAVGGLTGIRPLAEWGARNAQRNEEEASLNPASVPTLGDIHGVGDAATWAVEKFAENIPFLATTMATSGLGAWLSGGGKILGSTIIAKGLAQGIERRAAASLGAKAADEALLKATISAGQKYAGSAAGIVLGAAPIEGGGNWSEAINADPSLLDNKTLAITSIGTGIAAGLIETWGGNFKLFNKLLGANKGNIVRKTVGRVGEAYNKGSIPSVNDLKLLRRFAGEALHVAKDEARQETLQELLSVTNMAINDPNFKVTGETALRVLESAATGGTIGAFTGGTSGALSNKSSRVQNKINKLSDDQLGKTAVDFAEQVETEPGNADVAGIAKRLAEQMPYRMETGTTFAPPDSTARFSTAKSGTPITPAPATVPSTVPIISRKELLDNYLNAKLTERNAAFANLHARVTADINNAIAGKPATPTVSPKGKQPPVSTPGTTTTTPPIITDPVMDVDEINKVAEIRYDSPASTNKNIRKKLSDMSSRAVSMGVETMNVNAPMEDAEFLTKQKFTLENGFIDVDGNEYGNFTKKIKKTAATTPAATSAPGATTAATTPAATTPTGTATTAATTAETKTPEELKLEKLQKMRDEYTAIDYINPDAIAVIDKQITELQNKIAAKKTIPPVKTTATETLPPIPAKTETVPTKTNFGLSEFTTQRGVDNFYKESKDMADNILGSINPTETAMRLFVNMNPNQEEIIKFLSLLGSARVESKKRGNRGWKKKGERVIPPITAAETATVPVETVAPEKTVEQAQKEYDDAEREYSAATNPAAPDYAAKEKRFFDADTTLANAKEREKTKAPIPVKKEGESNVPKETQGQSKEVAPPAPIPAPVPKPVPIPVARKSQEEIKQLVLGALTKEPKHIDKIIRETGLLVGDVNSQLFMLELANPAQAVKHSGARWSLPGEKPVALYGVESVPAKKPPKSTKKAKVVEKKESILPIPPEETVAATEPEEKPEPLPKSKTPITPAEKPKNAVLGKVDTAYYGSGESVKVQWIVIDTDSVEASHDEINDAVNMKYPKKYQPRNRNSAGSKAQLHDIVSNFVPAKIGVGQHVSPGTTIVATEKENKKVTIFALSGNARLMALKKLYSRTDPNAKRKIAEYKAYFMDHAEGIGYTKESMAEALSSGKPGIFRILTEEHSEDDLRKLSVDMNEEIGAAMTTTETAKVDADKITPAMIHKFVPGKKSVVSLSNVPFARAFIGMIGSNAANAAISNDGSWTQTLIRRIEAAVFQKAYGDEDLLTLHTEAVGKDNPIKNITNALMNSAKNFMLLEKHKNQPIIKSTVSKIVEAVKYMDYVKGKESSIAEQDANQELFEGGVKRVNGGVRLLAEQLEKINRSPAEMAKLFKTIASTIEAEIVRTQGYENDIAGNKIAPVKSADAIIIESISPKGLFSKKKNVPEGDLVRFDFSNYKRRPVPASLTKIRESITGIPAEDQVFFALKKANLEKLSHLAETSNLTNHDEAWIANAELANELTEIQAAITRIIEEDIPDAENLAYDPEIFRADLLKHIEVLRKKYQHVLEQYAKSIHRIASIGDVEIFNIEVGREDYDSVKNPVFIYPYYPEIIVRRDSKMDKENERNIRELLLSKSKTVGYERGGYPIKNVSWFEESDLPEGVKEIDDSNFYDPLNLSHNRLLWPSIIETIPPFSDIETPEQFTEFMRERNEMKAGTEDEVAGDVIFDAAREAGFDGAVVTTGGKKHYAVFNENIRPSVKSSMKKTAGGKSAGLVRKWVKSIIDKFNLRIYILQSIGDLPHHLIGQAEAQARKGFIVKGIFDPVTRAIYVISDGVSSRKETLQLIIHEGVGHEGFRLVVGDEYDEFISWMLQSKYADDIRSASDRLKVDIRTAAEEWFAEQTESGRIDKALWTRFVAMVRRALKNLGFNIEFTDTDLRDLVRRSHEAVTKKTYRAIGLEQGETRYKKKVKESNITPDAQKLMDVAAKIFGDNYYAPGKFDPASGDADGKVVGILAPDGSFINVYGFGETHSGALFRLFNNIPAYRKTMAIEEPLSFGLRNGFIRTVDANHVLYVELASKPTPEQLKFFGKLTGNQVMVKGGVMVEAWNSPSMETRTLKPFTKYRLDRFIDFMEDYSGAADFGKSLKDQRMQSLAAQYRGGQEAMFKKGVPAIVPQKNIDILGSDETWRQLIRRTLQKKTNRLEDVQNEIGPVPKELDPDQAIRAMPGKVKEKSDKMEARVFRDKDSIMNRFAEETGLTIDDLGIYLTAYSAKETNDFIRNKGRKTDSGSGLTDERAASILAHYDGMGMEKYAKEMIGVARKALILRYRAGLITKEYLDELIKKRPNYVPYKGTGEKAYANAGIGKGFSLRSQEFFKAMGRKSLPDNPVVQIVLDYREAIIRAEKNRVDNRLARLIKANPDKDWNIKKQVYIPYFDAKGNPLGANPRYKIGDNEVQFKVKGKPYLMTINDKALVEGLKKVGTIKGIPILYEVNNFLRMMATVANPEFVFLTNISRDIQTAIFHLAGEHSTEIAKTALKNMPSAMRGIWDNIHKKDTPLARRYQEMKDNGGKVGWMDFSTNEQKQKQIERALKTFDNTKTGAAKRIINDVADYVKNWNEVMESGVRFAAYMALRDSGVSADKAAILVKDLTVDFNEAGNWGAILNSLYMFSGASIQGSYRILFKAMKHPRVQKIAGGVVAASFMSAMMNRWMDPDDYDQLSDYAKDNYWLFMTPSGKSLSIKLPYGYNVLKVLGNVMEEMTAGKLGLPKACGRILNSIGDAFNPLGGGSLAQFAAPTILDPFIQVWENKNFFGAPIRKEQPSWAEKPNSQLYFSTVREPTKMFTSWVNRITGGNEKESGTIDINPEDIDHFIDAIGGGLGKFVSNSITTGSTLATGDIPEIENFPFLRQVVKEKSEWVASRKAYDMLKESARRMYSEDQIKAFELNLERAIDNKVIERDRAGTMRKTFRNNQRKLQIERNKQSRAPAALPARQYGLSGYRPAYNESQRSGTIGLG